MAIVIDPEFENLCPALKPEEKAGLEADIITAGGAHTTLKLWGDILLDGHNRYDICTRLELPYDTQQIEGIATREDATNWIIDHQLHQRNLTPLEASYLRGKRYNTEKHSAGGDRKTGKSKPENQVLIGSTAHRLAHELGVGHDTISQDAAFAAGVDSIAVNVGTDTARAIRSGKLKLGKKRVAEIGKLPAKQQAKAVEEAQKPKPKKSKGKAMSQEREPLPGDLGQFVMWLRTGSMLVSRFKSGEDLLAYAAKNNVEFRDDHLAEVHQLLCEMVDVKEADRAA